MKKITFLRAKKKDIKRGPECVPVGVRSAHTLVFAQTEVQLEYPPDATAFVP